MGARCNVDVSPFEERKTVFAAGLCGNEGAILTAILIRARLLAENICHFSRKACLNVHGARRPQLVFDGPGCHVAEVSRIGRNLRLISLPDLQHIPFERTHLWAPMFRQERCRPIHPSSSIRIDGDVRLRGAYARCRTASSNVATGQPLVRDELSSFLKTPTHRIPRKTDSYEDKTISFLFEERRTPRHPGWQFALPRRHRALNCPLDRHQ